jgi:hypothetical protein
MQKISMRKKSFGDILALLLLTSFAFLLYVEIFTYHSFGPEFPLFYFYGDGLSLAQVLRSYTYIFLPWYRPTSASLFYWIGTQFLDWHDLTGWKAFHFWTFLAAAYALYWLVRRCLDGSRLAAFLAVACLIWQPSFFAVMMEVSSFDCLYILLAILCAGFYLQALRTSGLRSTLATTLSWVLFVVAITAKEMALAIPLFLLLAALCSLLYDPDGRPFSRRWAGEALRLAPFFAMLPVYYFVHLAKIPTGSFAGAGPYRDTAHWVAILANLRRFPLWIARIYAFTGDSVVQKLYLSTVINNAVGIGTFLLVVLQWIRRLRREPGCRFPLLLMLAWICAFLVIPTYAGGFFWHINLPLVGYCVLFGMAMAWWIEAIPSAVWRSVVLGLLLVGALLQGRENLHAELYHGLHASGFMINHSLLSRPPLPASQLGKAPLIYIEDRLGLGPWWYGCFGRLFDFVYLRHDVEEVVVPTLHSVPEDLRQRWLARPNAFFFRYDENYDWHDATAEFRDRQTEHSLLQPTGACATAGQTLQFSPVRPQAGALQWTIEPADAGSISPSGLYRAPREIPASRVVRVVASQPGSAGPFAVTTLSLGGRAPIRVAAGSEGLTDAAGRLWSADQSYRGGKTHSTTNSVAGTDTPRLYQSERFEEGPLAYRFCVANGTYQVTLKFAEIWFTEPGRRVFDIAINGTRVLGHFDPLAQAGGPNRAVDRRFPVVVNNGRLSIEFLPVVSNPKISAIEIVPASGLP